MSRKPKSDTKNTDAIIVSDNAAGLIGQGKKMKIFIKDKGGKLLKTVMVNR